MTTQYSNRMIEGKMCIWLQNYGFAPAKKAVEFKVGEKMLWNFGSKSEVVEIVGESKSFITIRSLCSDGNIYQSRLKKDRFVAIG